MAASVSCLRKGPCFASRPAWKLHAVILGIVAELALTSESHSSDNVGESSDDDEGYVPQLSNDVGFVVQQIEQKLFKEWQRPTDHELEAKLTAVQLSVTRRDGTEPPFRNTYWNNHAEGVYVDVVSGEPLFSSKDKFDSRTGWPSFTRPIPGVKLVENEDQSLGFERTEVRSRFANSHLGHVFPDGPTESTGLRYCMNSASLRFVPKGDMGKEGLGTLRNALFGQPQDPYSAELGMPQSEQQIKEDL